MQPGGWLRNLESVRAERVAAVLDQSKILETLGKELGFKMQIEKIPGMHPEVYSILQVNS